MSLFFVALIVFGIVMVLFYNKAKSLFIGNIYRKGANLGVLYFLLVIPGMLIIFSTFQISLLMIIFWWVVALIEGIVANKLISSIIK